MSLMTYQEAFPWGESVRAEVIAKHMPPWHAEDSAVRFKNQPTITSTEIDKILVWVSGSYPQGNPQNVPPRVTLQNDWAIGKPDLVLPLTEITLDPDTNEVTKEFTVATGSTETKWVRAVDLLPGTPSIVRDAIVSIKRQPTRWRVICCRSRRARRMDPRRGSGRRGWRRLPAAAAGRVDRARALPKNVQLLRP